MKLEKFNVSTFRSVMKSDRIETDGITGLIGTNESGKTNLLIPLWKLNPSANGEIDLIDDLPRKEYSTLRDNCADIVFIEAEFSVDAVLRSRISIATGFDVGDLETVKVARKYSGKYVVSYPGYELRYETKAGPIKSLVDKVAKSIEVAVEAEKEATDAGELNLKTALEKFSSESLSSDLVEAEVIKVFFASVGSEALKAASEELYNLLNKHAVRADATALEQLPAANKAVVSSLPKFVYYSNYGILDSEIYLPHVIENMGRSDLGAKDQAKANTLKVLFDFVGLDAEEIGELGKDLNTSDDMSEEEIQEVADRKRERAILLESAGTKLTSEFNEWFKQDDYIFSFKADGDHFRIMVSDGKRPEPIELEARSTGLQWFFCFYLVFLAEREDKHKNAILLLDEPGLTLHPLAQRDLSDFFEGIAKTNQILYTTHSPFMIDSDHLDRLKAVYVSDTGTTEVTEDLRAGSAADTRQRSIYAAHAAMGLTVSDVMLQGCKPIMIEGTSDQYYLSMIKNFLIAKGKFTPKSELLFFPSGGSKGIKAATPIVAGKNESLPVVVFDADEQGVGLRNSLAGGIYADDTDKLLNIGDYIGLDNAEIEDIVPGEWLADIVSRMLKGPEDDFDENYKNGEAIVPQIESWAEQNKIELKTGWKVDLAKRAKARFALKEPSLPSDLIASWASLFNKLDEL